MKCDQKILTEKTLQNPSSTFKRSYTLSYTIRAAVSIRAGVYSHLPTEEIRYLISSALHTDQLFPPSTPATTLAKRPRQWSAPLPP